MVPSHLIQDAVALDRLSGVVRKTKKRAPKPRPVNGFEADQDLRVRVAVYNPLPDQVTLDDIRILGHATPAPSAAAFALSPPPDHHRDPPGRNLGPGREPPGRLDIRGDLQAPPSEDTSPSEKPADKPALRTSVEVCGFRRVFAAGALAVYEGVLPRTHVRAGTVVILDELVTQAMGCRFSQRLVASPATGDGPATPGSPAPSPGLFPVSPPGGPSDTTDSVPGLSGRQTRILCADGSPQACVRRSAPPIYVQPQAVRFEVLSAASGFPFLFCGEVVELRLRLRPAPRRVFLAGTRLWLALKSELLGAERSCWHARLETTGDAELVARVQAEPGPYVLRAAVEGAGGGLFGRDVLGHARPLLQTALAPSPLGSGLVYDLRNLSQDAPLALAFAHSAEDASSEDASSEKAPLATRKALEPRWSNLGTLAPGQWTGGYLHQPDSTSAGAPPPLTDIAHAIARQTKQHFVHWTHLGPGEPRFGFAEVPTNSANP
ncbi:hypothetical protein GNI_110250 [Gregarina niphandrodes]|uniref:Uncharacterized protein n=1 Tax=Gregarina niphandrodes TaxID=110365 RepID=A0A023B3N4_GRENI|nr:hypothetical protein GNI_110250 [Gregarina niphandrodes]EZG55654.1 hypothetical protein GNI_110250 [Gregarina niphandrodes]|eukprot:XP_011131473.1 hypothetical protein GNI_110250 [Gregarina niphandrodes]